MRQPAGPSPLPRPVAALFWAVLALVLAQMGWWVVFHIRFSRAESRRQLAAWQASLPVAARAVAREARLVGSPMPGLPPAVLARDFPDLLWAPTALRPDPAQEGLYPGWAPQVRPEGPARLARRDRQHVRMFLFEGSFFVALLLLGAARVRRALRREVGMILQQANFLSAVTHELKSPLASVRLFAETLQLRALPAATQSHYLGTILQETERLDRLVGNLLAAARLDAGRLLVRVEQLDLGAQVGAWVAEFGAEQRGQPLPVTTQLPSAPLLARADPSALRLALRNLLDNAAKYGLPQRRPVEVAVAQQGAWAMVAVRDFGRGLAPGEAERVFDRFYRAGDEMVRNSAGSGLGLYLARTLVEAQGGWARADSDGPDAGATFSLAVPLASEGA